MYKLQVPLYSLIRCKNTSRDVTLNHNGSSISDPSVIAEVFNNYFANIASNHHSNIPHSNISQLNFLGAPVENLFFSPPPCDSEEIVNLIRRQKNKSNDPLNIPVFIYKILAPLISPTISMIINNVHATVNRVGVDNWLQTDILSLNVS